jgi:hypothetical protein
MSTGTRHRGSRTTASVFLIVVAALLLLAGTVAFYARQQVVDRQAFADRAVAALDDDAVRELVSRQIVTYAIDRGASDLIAARPVLESVVASLAGTEPFQRVFRAAAVQANRAFVDRGRDNVLFDLGDAAEIVEFGLRSVSPSLAEELPRDLKPDLLSLRDQDFAGTTLRVADHVRLLGVVLPLLALAAVAGAVAVAPDRRIAVLRAGVAVGGSGALLAVALLILRARTIAGVHGEDELTDDDVRAAVGGLLDAFLDDLLAWALLLSLLGLLIGAAAAALDREDVQAPVRRVRRLAERPRAAWAQALRGAAALALGIFVVLSPMLAVQIAAVIGGAFLVFLGTSELLAPLGRSGHSRAEARRTRARALVGAGAVGSLLVGAAAALAVVITSSGPDPSLARSSTPSGGCNGMAGLCDLRLNEVVFAGTHNGFSAADSPGWSIANQRRTIPRQLRDGIRLLLIDPHWGVQGSDGAVRTDFASEGRSRNRVAKGLPPNVLRSAEHLVGRIGVGGGKRGKRDIWLCHTVCELGATRMVDSLTEIRTFLDDNRGEVVILFIEPYVRPADIAKAFSRAGLDRSVVTLDHGEPLPTLGELVRSDRRLIVLTEKDADGALPWYLDGFSFVQDTPLGATKVAQLSCKLERGSKDSPMLMLNHWADVFPPQRSANAPFLKQRVILQRAHECERERGLPVSLIAVDHYDQGALVKAVKALNVERVHTLRDAEAGSSSG